MIVDHDDIALRAGRLLHQVVIERKTETQSSTGAPIETWSTFATVWANMMPLSGKEFLRAEQLQSSIQATCVIRWLDGVVPTMRVVFKGLKYNISAILADPRFARHLTLMLEQGLSQG
jgi:SPP1 family predicted phage head-tail adaptor